jgi:hypothetical protein
MLKVFEQAGKLNPPQIVKKDDEDLFKFFYSMIERLTKDTEQSESSAKLFASKMKNLATEINNSYKKFSDLKKTECKAYLKLKGQFSNQINKMYEVARKVSRSKEELGFYQTAVSKRFDARQGKQIRAEDLCHFEAKETDCQAAFLKAQKEYEQFKLSFAQDLGEFNIKKLKFCRIFNAYSESIDNRMKDSLNLYLKRLREFVMNFKMCEDQKEDPNIELLDEPMTNWIRPAFHSMSQNLDHSPLLEGGLERRDSLSEVLLNRLNRTETLGPAPTPGSTRFVSTAYAGDQ